MLKHAPATIVQRRCLDRIASNNWYRRTAKTISQQVFVDLRRAGWLVSPVLEGQLRLGAARLHVIGIDP